VTGDGSAAQPTGRNGWRSLPQQVVRIDWKQTEGRAALLCLPAAAAILVVAIAVGRPIEGAVATIGAVSVGFGSFRRFTRFRSLPMQMPALGMAVRLGLLGVFVAWRQIFLPRRKDRVSKQKEPGQISVT